MREVSGARLSVPAGLVTSGWGAMRDSPLQVRSASVYASTPPGSRLSQEPVRVIDESEANEWASESGRRSDDRGGVAKATPHEGGASTPLAAPQSFAAAGALLRQAPSGQRA